MKFLRKILDSLEPKFKKGGQFERFYPLYEATDTFLFTPNIQTKSGPHVRDNVDLKRVLILVVVALVPCYIFGAINIGYLNAISEGISRGWIGNLFFGLRYILPILVVTLAVGGFWEVLFSIIRKHEITEGFLVTSALIPLISPPNLPLWMLAVGTTFGIVVGKEVFGGTGMNIFNPAMTTRAFIYFAYPTEMSGDKIWMIGPDGYSGATALSLPAAITDGNSVDILNNFVQFDYSWLNMFIGFIPGSIGETNKILIILAGMFLIYTKVASWRIIVGCTIGLMVTAFIFNLLSPFSSNTMLTIPPHYHLVMGSFLFGTVFMATEPVTSAHTNKGKWIYGIMIGFLTVIIRSINPAYPEGAMLAILLMNAFAPAIDYFVVKENISNRLKKYAK